VPLVEQVAVAMHLFVLFASVVQSPPALKGTELQVTGFTVGLGTQPRQEGDEDTHLVPPDGVETTIHSAAAGVDKPAIPAAIKN
jgi:hypothetical protein